MEGWKRIDTLTQCQVYRQFRGLVLRPGQTSHGRLRCRRSLGLPCRSDPAILVFRQSTTSVPLSTTQGGRSLGLLDLEQRQHRHVN